METYQKNEEIWKSLHFFDKSFLFLFLLSFYPYFGTFTFHVVSEKYIMLGTTQNFNNSNNNNNNSNNNNNNNSNNNSKNNNTNNNNNNTNNKSTHLHYHT